MNAPYRMPLSPAASPVAAAREQLLIPTLAHAAKNIPYYRETFGETWKQVRKASDLPLLPLLYKEVAIEQQERLRVEGMPNLVGIISSGTMLGDRRPLRMLRTEAEHKATDAFLRNAAHLRAREGQAYLGFWKSEGLLLDVRSMQHGLPEGPPAPGRIRVPWSFTPNALRLMEELLVRPYSPEQRITAMALTPAALLPLTMYLLERGVSPDSLGVREISTNGYRLPSATAARLEEIWGATLYDSYSLSEFYTGSIECKECGFNHWFGAPVVFEVVDAFTHAQLEEGVGVLVLTGLIPFMQSMPLIRYVTADLMEWGPRCSRAGERGLRFRGRVRHSLLHPGTPGEPALVYPADVNDFLGGRPEVARHPHPSATLELVDSPDLGPPRFELSLAEGARPRAQVKVEVRFDVRLFARAAAALKEELRAFLVQRSRALDALLRQDPGALDVEVVSPGRLKQRFNKF